ncbi:hypothetical protein D3C71_1931870 [compost metagenome]
MAVTAEPFGELVQALQQLGRERGKTDRLTQGRQALGTLLDHIVAQNAFDPVIKTVVQAHQGNLLQALPKG